MARYRSGLRTEARIIDATRALLSEVGLEGTTLKAICDRAGIQAGSFYNVFDSKEAVILRVVREAITAVDPHPEGDEPDTLDELVDAFIAFITKQSDVARVYLQIAATVGLTDDSVGRRLRRQHQRRTERFARALARRRPDLDEATVQRYTQILLAALNGLAYAWLLDPDTDFEGNARSLLDVV